MTQTATTPRYYMTSKSSGEVGRWESCSATSLRGAKAECTRRYGLGWRDALLCVATGDDVVEQRHLLSQRRNTAARWTDF